MRCISPRWYKVGAIGETSDLDTGGSMTETQLEPRVRRQVRGVNTPYQQFQKREGIPIHKGSAIPDLYDLKLTLWPRMGQKAAFVNLGDQEYDDGRVIEIAPRGQSEVQHHVFESSVLVL